VLDLLKDLAGFNEPKLTFVYQKDGVWCHLPKMYSGLEYPLGDWWPAFLLAHFIAWAKHIQSEFTDLDLTELIQITKHLEMDDGAVSAFGGEYNRTDRNVIAWLNISNDTHWWGHINWNSKVVELDNTEGVCYRPNDPRWLYVVDNLGKREESLKVNIPQA
jgi:hypothetical protein